MQVDCEFCADGAPATVVAAGEWTHLMCNCHRDAFMAGQLHPDRKVTAIYYPGRCYFCYDGRAVAVGAQTLSPLMCATCRDAYLAGQSGGQAKLWWLYDVVLEQASDFTYTLVAYYDTFGHLVEVRDGHLV